MLMETKRDDGAEGVKGKGRWKSECRGQRSDGESVLVEARMLRAKSRWKTSEMNGGKRISRN